MEILFHVPMLMTARGLCSSVFTPKPRASGLGTVYCHRSPIDSPFLSQPTRFPGLSLFWELLHRKRSHGLSLFSKRIKLRVSECNANWFVITQRTEATSLKANTAKPGGSS